MATRSVSDLSRRAAEVRIPGVSITGMFFDAGTIDAATGQRFYGHTATDNKEPFKSIVVHHTAENGSLEQFARIGHHMGTRGSSKGYFGYHFLVSGSQVVQAAPMDVRTNHSGAKKLGGTSSVFHNESAIGVSFIGGGEYVPRGKERETGLKLIAGLMKMYRIPKENIEAHVNTDSKSNNEGLWIHDAIANGELDQYLGGGFGNPFDIKGFERDVVATGLGGLVVGGLILGGIYAWRRFVKTRAEKEAARELVRNREMVRKITTLRNKHKDLIEKAKTDPMLAAQMAEILARVGA